MANEMFSSLPDVMTAEQLASALQISKSALRTFEPLRFPDLTDRRQENGNEKGSAGMAAKSYQQTEVKIRS